MIFKNEGVIMNFFSVISRFFMLFVYNYLYNHVSYNNAHKLNESLRKNLCCVPYVRSGTQTDVFVDSVIIRASIISVLMTVGFLAIPYFVGSILPCKNVIKNGIDIMIMANAFMNIVEFMKSVYQYNAYRFDYGGLINYNQNKSN